MICSGYFSGNSALRWEPLFKAFQCFTLVLTSFTPKMSAVRARHYPPFLFQKISVTRLLLGGLAGILCAKGALVPVIARNMM